MEETRLVKERKFFMSQELAKKLRLNLDEPIYVIYPPTKEYFSAFNIFDELPSEPVETIILFVKTLEEMQIEIQQLIDRQALAMGGRLLVCYPKKGNKVFPTFIHRDEILPALKVNQEGYIDQSDYKFNQMVKLDDVYTIIGLKRTVTKKKRTSSQSVADYVQFIPELENLLAKTPAALQFFQELTPGYQRNWARFVFSVKREVTREKHLKETIELLLKGIKSKDLA